MLFVFKVALQALKRKKRYEKQLQQIDGTLTTIELQRQTLEDASTSGQVLQTMKNAADALKKVHQSMYVALIGCSVFVIALWWFFLGILIKYMI